MPAIQAQTTIEFAEDEYLDDAEQDDECPMEPPITPDSLSELETTRIFNNPKLRHDVNFDRELHFRPNLDGSRGKQKTKTAKRFWKAVETELRKIENLHEHREAAQTTAEHEKLKAEIKTVSKRIPKVFAAVRDILKSLVPEADQSKITDRLDVDLIMQQIVNGVLDIVSLASWLAQVIKTHCAPMRDAKVNLMEQTIKQAEKAQDLHVLADGLRQLVDIMEAMKLDVANHQIRHIRLLLIKNTVDFQQRYNAHRISINRLDTNKALTWLKCEIALIYSDIQHSTPLDAVCSALLWDMISPHGSEPFTPTFYLDFDRLKSMSAEIHNYIHREICHALLTELLAAASADYVLEAWNQLRIYFAAATEPQDWFESNVENIAAQIARIAANAPGANEQEPAIYKTAVDRLSMDLRKDHDTFARQKATLFHRVLPKLQASVHKHKNFSAVELQDSFVPQVTKASSARPNGFGAVLVPALLAVPADQDATLVRRLTHIIVLHWQVWAELLYLNEEDYDTNELVTLMHGTLPSVSVLEADVAYAPAVHSADSPVSSPVSMKDENEIEHEIENGGLDDGSEDFTSATENDNTLPDY
ncbi:hypothetical protein AMS68_002966 [Peltaster fructicola]|uniref:Uncharacterized protein n=1 Tax=Peltaster fructicola TaxID=286661 RepID=A0A6H0XS47_9PEZI|nr:hypothetical protein AMS68_002966 [Peltaster fructicola]